MGFVSVCCANAANSQPPITPYHGIVERNVFDLRAPVAVAAVPVPNPIVLPKITLTGITTIFGRTIVFITIAGNKPGQLPESVMLAEGQSVQEIEVKTVHYKSGVVQVINHGLTQTLDFERDGAKTSGASWSAPVSVAAFLPPPQPVPRGEAALSPEEQVALIEIQREKFRQEDNPIRHLLPPTEMSPEGAENVSP